MPKSFTYYATRRYIDAHQPMSESESLAVAREWGLGTEALLCECRLAASRDDMEALVSASKLLAKHLFKQFPQLYGKTPQ